MASGTRSQVARATSVGILVEEAENSCASDEQCHPDSDSTDSDLSSLPDPDEESSIQADNPVTTNVSDSLSKEELMRILIEERRRNDEERREDRQAIRQFMETMAQCNNDSTATSSKPTIYKMQDPLRYNGGSSELKAFLRALRSNFDSHPHLFPRKGADFVQYAVTRLGTWK